MIHIRDLAPIGLRRPTDEQKNEVVSGAKESFYCVESTHWTLGTKNKRNENHEKSFLASSDSFFFVSRYNGTVLLRIQQRVVVLIDLQPGI